MVGNLSAAIQLLKIAAERFPGDSFALAPIGSAHEERTPL
jgi:hypothetical protein